MKQNLFVLTVLRKKKSIDGSVNIIYYRLKIHWHGVLYVIEISSLLCVESKNWCSSLQRLKTKDDKSTRINRQVEKHINSIKDLFDEFKVVSTDFAPNAFKQQIYRIVNPAKFKDVPTNTGALSIYDDYLSVHRSTFGPKRVLRYKLLQRLESEYFQQTYRRKDMPLSVYSYAFYFGFKNFLLSDGKRKTNTVDGYLKVLRAAINYAVISGKLKSHPFFGIKHDKIEYTRRFLTQEEIALVANLNSLSPKLERARDHFMIQVYTGISYSDLKKLRPEQIQRIGGRNVVVDDRQKSRVEFTVPLIPRAEELISRWRNRDNPSLLLKVPCLEDYNRSLKVIQAMCGIRKNLSSHVGRHSFSCAYLAAGGSFEVLSKMLGHSSIRTTQGYGKIMKERVLDETDFVFKKFLFNGNIDHEKLYTGEVSYEWVKGVGR